ncbi:SEC-C motif domain protein [Melittangium boletus DSM 14713]|uniref:SEC-C motif domain protein n=2 Tax=Melittangium boletus TaxID=83453 RepID=A0A250IFW6_9BACT|nr:SEC-C motif domain protein [Melittangium boletus DSM 14713]
MTAEVISRTPCYKSCMNVRNMPCACGSGLKTKRCCGGKLPAFLGLTPAYSRPPPPGLDAVTTEAYLRSQEVLCSPDVLQRMSDCMVVLRGMFREGGPLASLRWPWEEFVPVVERHLFRVMAEVRDVEGRHERLFQRCAPELLDSERLARMDQTFRRELMSSERSAAERSALAMVVMELLSAPRHPPFPKEGLSMVAWLMMGQVDEWVERRQRMHAAVGEALGASSGNNAVLVESPEGWEEALEGAVESDPELVALLGQYEVAILRAIIEGSTPTVLQGEEWLWMTAVLRAPLRIDPERASEVDTDRLLRMLDGQVQQDVLRRVEAAGRDSSSEPEAEQWFSWAHKVMVSRPVAFFGAFAKAREAFLRERFAGESDWVHLLQRREHWRAEDLEPYRLRLESLGASGAARCVGRLQAWLRGEVPEGGGDFKV